MLKVLPQGLSFILRVLINKIFLKKVETKDGCTPLSPGSANLCGNIIPADTKMIESNALRVICRTGCAPPRLTGARRFRRITLHKASTEIPISVVLFPRCVEYDFAMCS